MQATRERHAQHPAAGLAERTAVHHNQVSVGRTNNIAKGLTLPLQVGNCRQPAMSDDPTLTRVAALLGQGGDAFVQEQLHPPGGQPIQASMVCLHLGAALQANGLGRVLEQVAGSDSPEPLSPERNAALMAAVREVAALCFSSERKRRPAERAGEAGPAAKEGACPSSSPFLLSHSDFCCAGRRTDSPRPPPADRPPPERTPPESPGFGTDPPPPPWGELLLRAVGALRPPEPLAVALEALECLVQECKPTIQDNEAQLQGAVAELVNLCSRRADGLAFALTAVNALGLALLDGRQVVRCSDPGCSADWPLSLHGTVTHFSDKAPPLNLRSQVAPTHRAVDMAPNSLFVMGPSVLGTFYGVGQCHRYLHVRTERRFLASAASAQDATGGAVSSVVAALSKDAATLAKGHLWEEALNKQLDGKALPTALLRDGGSWDGAGACNLRDMTRATPAGTACTCAAGRRQPAKEMWEVRHVQAAGGSVCAYTAALLRVSLDALHTDPVGTIIYQPYFELPSALMTHNDVTLDPSVISFSKWQPDYLFVRRGRGGVREVVVVDAKASNCVKESHKVQVAFYSFALRYMLANPQPEWRGAALAAAPSTVAPFGAVWLPDTAQPETFLITDLENRLQLLL